MTTLESIIAIYLLGAALSVITGFTSGEIEDEDGNTEYSLKLSAIAALAWPALLLASAVMYLMSWSRK